ncbi:class I SAM-dependent DNA methyltransferase [Acidobacteriota bacterium]
MIVGTQIQSDEFRSGLELLDMYVPERPDSSGLILSGQKTQTDYEYIALEKAKRYGVDAVYFRRFDTGRAPIAQVYIYDYTQNEPDDETLGELQRRLWNSGQVPLFFVFTKTEIKIFNCLQKPIIDIKTRKVVSSPMKTIKLAAKVEKELKEFSARKFDNGCFWETSKYKDKFNLSESSYEMLISHLKKIRDDIIKEAILEKRIVQKLLVMAILVKYLEEREDEHGNTVFPEGFFSQFASGARKFTDILKERGACLKLFDYLSEHFNGEIFAWRDDEEREQLSQTDLTPFARFLEARTDLGGQGMLWPLYSFNDLPIELISNIYEEFLEDKDGIVYTPPYLVNFLIDEAMPLTEAKTDFKVLDPVCGSGIFLVAAFKRIIDRWRIQNNWKTPDLNILKKLLKDNIFGTDIESEVVRLTIFSLSLVLFDTLSPKVIWQELKFDNLKSSGNLFDKDFFELINKNEFGDKFDLVIGNPPFKSDLTQPAWIIEKEQKKYRAPIPDQQVSLLFLEQSLTLCKSGGLLCLIVPAGPFLYNYGSVGFRRHFLQTCNTKQILDFTFLREILFGSANAAVAAVYAKKEEPEFKNILHATFRRTKLSKEKIYLELDHYDLHTVSYHDALKSPLIWKSNLLGGGRLHFLIARFSKLIKFGDYLQKRKKSDGWVVAEGFIIGSKKKINRLTELCAKGSALTSKEEEELKKLKRDYKRADYLTGKETLPTDALTEEGIDETQIHLLKEDFFYRRAEKNKQIFKGPHILIKEEAARNSVPIAFRDDDLSFKDKIIGIHAPLKYRQELLDIEKIIKGNNVCLFCAYVFSRQHMISRGDAILKKDIENIFFPNNESELEISEIEKILVDDVLGYMPDFRYKGEKSKILQPVNPDQLRLFGETYCKILNSVYKRFKSYKPIITENFVCFPIYYSEKPQIDAGSPEEFEENLDQLIYNKMGRNLRLTRVLRIYDNNVIYLVKPKQLRYWLRSTAIRDADETFLDLVKQGY